MRICSGQQETRNMADRWKEPSSTESQLAASLFLHKLRIALVEIMPADLSSLILKRKILDWRDHHVAQARTTTRENFLYLRGAVNTEIYTASAGTLLFDTYALIKRIEDIYSFWLRDQATRILTAAELNLKLLYLENNLQDHQNKIIELRTSEAGTSDYGNVFADLTEDHGPLSITQFYGKNKQKTEKEENQENPGLVSSLLQAVYRAADPPVAGDTLRNYSINFLNSKLRILVFGDADHLQCATNVIDSHIRSTATRCLQDT